MRPITKFLRAALCAALVLAAIPGCSSDEDGANDTTSSTTAPTTTVAETLDPEAQRQEIKKTYKLDTAITDANSPAKIIYGGFESKTFSTPAISDEADLVTITPIYSHSGIKDYVQNYSTAFDLGKGEGSFLGAAEKYTEEFFNDKALLFISFLDKDGGANYEVKGAWEEIVVGSDFEMEKFVVATKKADGDVTAGHVIVELDAQFLAVWDTFGIEFFK